MHLLDCGLVVEVGPEQHVNMIKILGAFTRRNGRVAGQLMVDTSRDCQAGPEDVELFVKGIELICFEDEGQNFIEKIGEYIADICYMACKHKVKLEASFINMALGIEIMEGMYTLFCSPLSKHITATLADLYTPFHHSRYRYSVESQYSSCQGSTANGAASRSHASTAQVQSLVIWRGV
jgi:predicted unusual protein kinase regulating ubiquinone biosynthesis (AarF/ABC1/UbiB family)